MQIDSPMKISQLMPQRGCAHVQDFIRQVLDLQFPDVQAMLRLPCREIGVTPACNIAIVATLCNMISGVSTTIYKPAEFHHEARSRVHSGETFKRLVREFFPYTPTGTADFATELYDYARNPLAHSAGVSATPPLVRFDRFLVPPNNDRGWTFQELADFETGAATIPFPGVSAKPGEWTVCPDAFYIDVINMLRRLTDDAAQMTAAENRFAQNVYIWRIR
jgi:hypothetical protein